MTLFVALDDEPIVMGAVYMPMAGIWYADLVLQSPKALDGDLVLHLSDLTMPCAAIRAVAFAGARGVRVVGGVGGWRKAISPRQYANGVTASTVLQDAAAAVGERVVMSSDRVLGNFIRRHGIASLVLQSVWGSSWWMRPDGAVTDAPRVATPIVSDFVAMSVVGAQGLYTIATETVADWMPARTFVGPTASGTINRVEHRITKGELRTLVMTS